MTYVVTSPWEWSLPYLPARPAICLACPEVSSDTSDPSYLYNVWNTILRILLNRNKYMNGYVKCKVLYWIINLPVGRGPLSDCYCTCTILTHVQCSYSCLTINIVVAKSQCNTHRFNPIPIASVATRTLHFDCGLLKCSAWRTLVAEIMNILAL